MKVRQLIQRSPEGAPVVGASVRFVRVSDGATLFATASDEDGFVEYTADANPGPFFMLLEGQPGGAKYWASYDSMAAGALSLMEVPYALRPLGDGVVRGYLNELAVSTGTGNTVTLATGVCMAAGIPVCNYSADTIGYTRPVTSTRIDRVVCRVFPQTGLAVFGRLAGEEGGSVPALTQTESLWEVSLAQLSIPTVAPVTITDERAFVTEKLDDSGEARVDSITTTSAGGEALAGLITTLDIPRPGTYDIVAEFTARQGDSAVVTTWVLQTTIGSLGSSTGQFNNPKQVAVDSSSNVYVADNANNRVQKFDSTGTYVSSISVSFANGVDVDASGNIYISALTSLKKYNSALVLQWTQTFGSALRHVATDDTNVYVTDSIDNKVWKRLCSTGAAAAVPSWGIAGTGNGEFALPWGVAWDGSFLYVVDSGNERVQKFNASGTYQTQWGSAGTGDGQFGIQATGCAIDDSGDVWVCDPGNNRLQRFSNTGTYQTTITQTTPGGADLATGDVLWVSNETNDNLAKWDETATPGGYGQVAIEIDGSVGTYEGIGNRDGAVGNISTATKDGPSTVIVRVFGKATAATMTLKSCVLSARATPRR